MPARKRRTKKKHSPKEVPEAVKAARERNRPEPLSDDRPAAGGGSRLGSADFKRAAQRRHQAK